MTIRVSVPVVVEVEEWEAKLVFDLDNDDPNVIADLVREAALEGVRSALRSSRGENEESFDEFSVDILR